MRSYRFHACMHAIPHSSPDENSGFQICSHYALRYCRRFCSLHYWQEASPWAVYLYLVIISLTALIFFLISFCLVNLIICSSTFIEMSISCHMHLHTYSYVSLMIFYGHKLVTPFVCALKWTNHSQHNNRVKNASGSCPRPDLVFGLVTLALP
jgi:hypothetical protein